MTGPTPPAGGTAWTVAVLVVEDCPSRAGAERAMAAALHAAGVAGVEVRTTVVTSPAQADATGFAGSPSFHINGRDLFPAAATAGGASADRAALSCRLYPTARGPAGLPEQDALVAAVVARTADDVPGGDR